MRSERTSESPRLTLLRGGAGEEENGSASTIYGPVRAGLTTSHRTQSQALSGLLNDLESGIADLDTRYSEVLDTLASDILPRVGRLLSITRMDTTDVLE
jgi:hypothetical protein